MARSITLLVLSAALGFSTLQFCAHVSSSVAEPAAQEVVSHVCKLGTSCS